MPVYIREEELMAGTLYQTIFQKGKAKGRTEGKAEGRAEVHAHTIVRLLARWLGTVAPALRERIRAERDLGALTLWYDEILYVSDAEAAQRLAEKIQRALSP
jgi:predicted transposase YdaD